MYEMEEVTVGTGDPETSERGLEDIRVSDST